ncbi:MAG: hypothetical protein CBC13_10930 [Planctomycetia bacterium TMED53]|nr:MAG: hypothetical protein CBC13_10930 [Planctomycetia bacterium TMED53]
MRVPAPHAPASAGELQIPHRSELVPLPLATLEADSKIPVDIYLDHDGDWILCRSQGDLLSTEVRRELLEAGKDALWMPLQQRQHYLEYLRSSIRGEWNPRSGIVWVSDFLEQHATEKPQVIEAVYRRVRYALLLAHDVGIDGGDLLDDFCRGMMLLGAKLEGLDLSSLAEEHCCGDSVRAILEGYQERFDGTGPRGWSREQQRLPVRIASLVIAFDEATMGGPDLSSDRRRCAFDVLRSFIVEDHGAYDPRLVAGFIRILER